MTEPALEIDLPYLKRDTDRHGNVRLYVRVKGRSMVRLREPPGTAAFLKEYRAAVSGDAPQQTPQPVLRRVQHGSLRWLVTEYFKSADFRRLHARTQRVRRGLLNRLCDTNGRGEHPYRLVQSKHVRMWRDEKTERPGSANNLLKALRHLFAWAVEAEHLKASPAEGVKLFTMATEGWHTWSIEEVQQYEARHPLGTKAHMALALLLFTGVRRSDVVKLGRQMERRETDATGNPREWLHFTEQKGITRTPKVRDIPILPQLREALDAGPSGHLAYLVSERDRAFSDASFGAWFRKRCDEAGLHHCTAHGLRKAGATIAAENGATGPQLLAIYGWAKLTQAEVYIRKAQAKKLAGDAMHLVAPKKWATGEKKALKINKR